MEPLWYHVYCMKHGIPYFLLESIQPLPINQSSINNKKAIMGFWIVRYRNTVYCVVALPLTIVLQCGTVLL
jgi:hypothetical protein